ncbi:MAG: hypothetical protein R3A44_04360 [Caldilineaceae bacterium]
MREPQWLQPTSLGMPMASWAATIAAAFANFAFWQWRHNFTLLNK